MIDKVIAFAKEHGYESVTLGKGWNGYQVYEPYCSKNEISYVGYPLVILVKESEIRMSTAEESIEYLHFSQPIEHNNI